MPRGRPLKIEPSMCRASTGHPVPLASLTEQEQDEYWDDVMQKIGEGYTRYLETHPDAMARFIERHKDEFEVEECG